MAIRKVSTSEVRRVLGEPSTALSALCTSGKVKHWSRFKPMDMPGIAYDRDMQTSGFWKGKKSISWSSGSEFDYDFIGEVYLVETCGLRFYAFTEAEDLINVFYIWNTDTVDNPLAGNYAWDKPKGGEKSPYRLADFSGYDHKVGCQFWSDATEDPMQDDETMPKYNLQAPLPIVCAFDTFDIGGGYSGLSMTNLIESIGGSGMRLRIVDYDETADIGQSILKTEAVGIVADHATVEFIPSTKQRDYMSIFYMVEFRDEYGKTLFVPLTQTMTGGGNTDVTFVEGTRYTLKRFKVETKPPTTMQLLEFKTLWNGEWQDIVGQSRMQTPYLYLHFSAHSSTPFIMSARCMKFTFMYKKSDGERGEYEIDGSAAYNTDFGWVRVSHEEPQSIRGENEPFVMQTTDNVYVSLPEMTRIPYGGVIPSGSTISYMVVKWRAGEEQPWVNISTYNINLITV